MGHLTWVFYGIEDEAACLVAPRTKGQHNSPGATEETSRKGSELGNYRLTFGLAESRQSTFGGAQIVGGGEQDL